LILVGLRMKKILQTLTIEQKITYTKDAAGFDKDD
jgi:hypothetical protein